MHPAAQRATLHAGRIFGSGTDQQPPAPCWPAALASCSRSPEQLEPPSVACVGHLWAGAALLRSSELALVPAGVSGLSLRSPCPAPWGTGASAARQQRRPAAGFHRLFSNVLQLVPRAQLPACFWEPSAELRALRRGQSDPACSCLRTLRPSAPFPRCSVLVFGCGAVPRVPLSHDPCIGSRAWQPREQIGGAGPAWARPSVRTGTEASP